MSERHWIVFKHYKSLYADEYFLSLSPFDPLRAANLCALERFPRAMGITAQEAHEQLKSVILRKARQLELDAENLSFAWEEGFGYLDPAIPLQNLQESLRVLVRGTSVRVNDILSGAIRLPDYPYDKLHAYLLREGSA